MEILLIRHGETALNAERIIQYPDTPLNERGLQQAEHLGRHLATRSIELVLSSDYLRARMTAEQLISHSGAPLQMTTELRERNFGDVRGTPYAEFGDIDIFADDYEPPAGESRYTFHARVDRAWEEVLSIAEPLDGDLAVVTHGLVLSSLIDRVLDVSAHLPESDLVVANTSVTIVEPEHPWRVIKLASIEHLPHPLVKGAPV